MTSESLGETVGVSEESYFSQIATSKHQNHKDQKHQNQNTNSKKESNHINTTTESGILLHWATQESTRRPAASNCGFGLFQQHDHERQNGTA